MKWLGKCAVASQSWNRARLVESGGGRQRAGVGGGLGGRGRGGEVACGSGSASERVERGGRAQVERGSSGRWSGEPPRGEGMARAGPTRASGGSGVRCWRRGFC